MSAETKLPIEILKKASLRGNEYAWPIEDIPAVVEAARQASLLNIGGQLQFRLPDGICECYWVEVDTYKDVVSSLPWEARVEQAARTATTSFFDLQKKFNFIKEGRENFPDHFSQFEKQGGQLEQSMCFVWYVASKEDELPT